MMSLLISLLLGVQAHEHKEPKNTFAQLYAMITGDCCASMGNPHKKLVELLIQDTKADVLFVKLDEMMKPLPEHVQALLGTLFN